MIVIRQIRIKQNFFFEKIIIICKKIFIYRNRLMNYIVVIYIKKNLKTLDSYNYFDLTIIHTITSFEMFNL